MKTSKQWWIFTLINGVLALIALTLAEHSDISSTNGHHLLLFAVMPLTVLTCIGSLESCLKAWDGK